MLDSDLAELYQVLKRHSERFSNNFMFQLSEEEYKSLRSQCVNLDNKVMGLLQP